MFAQLGTQGAPLARPLLAQLGTLCAAANMAAAEGGRGGPASHLGGPCEACIKAALQHMGPAVVLEVLPLHLQEVVHEEGGCLWEGCRGWVVWCVLHVTMHGIAHHTAHHTTHHATHHTTHHATHQTHHTTHTTPHHLPGNAGQRRGTYMALAHACSSCDMCPVARMVYTATTTGT